MVIFHCHVSFPGGQVKKCHKIWELNSCKNTWIEHEIWMRYFFKNLPSLQPKKMQTIKTTNLPSNTYDGHSKRAKRSWCRKTTLFKQIHVSLVQLAFGKKTRNILYTWAASKTRLRWRSNPKVLSPSLSPHFRAEGFHFRAPSLLSPAFAATFAVKCSY